MTIPDPRERPTIGVEEAGKILGLGRAAAYAAAARGELPGLLKIGRRLVVATATFSRALGFDQCTCHGDNVITTSAPVTPLRRTEEAG